MSYMSPRSRPRSVTLLVILVLTVAVVNLIRIAQAIQQWEFLEEFSPVPPIYLLISGCFWGMAGLLLVWGLWTGRKWAPVWTGLAFLAYSAYFWVDRLALPGYPGRNANWVFALGLNLALLGSAFWILYRKRSRVFFGGVHE